MIFFLRSFFLVALVAIEGRALSIPKRRSDLTSPVVTLDYGSYQGRLDQENVQVFLGMDYAQPPVGDLRFRLPANVSSFKGVQQATQWGASCPQQNYTLPNLPGIDYDPLAILHTQVKPAEDCLHLNVFRPANTASDAKLPVVVWIHGGAFETGDASAFNATRLVARSMAVGQPIIYVSFNYRLNGFGFLAGQEVMDAGTANLGLFDQRQALEWVQSYISNFGGDPDKVTLWGESAGSVSITSHILTFPGHNETLFHSVIMHSTSMSPMVATNHIKHQANYDFIVEQTGCSGQNSTLDCVRKAPFQSLMSAINALPSQFSSTGLNFTFAHSVDGNFFDRTLKQYVADGIYADVPLIFGTVDDEGTLFSLSMSENVTDSQATAATIENLFLPGVNSSAIQQVLSYYPADPAAGSPFDTPSIQYSNSEFKRLAAFQGDFTNQAARRDFLGTVSETQNTWSFIWKRNKGDKYLGSVHSGELPEFYGFAPNVTDNVATDVIVNFANTHNPNTPDDLLGKTNSLLNNITWPMWDSDSSNPPMFVFSDDPTESYEFISDTFRAEQIQYLDALEHELGL